MHWKNISKNPVSLKVHKFLLEELRQKKVITDTSHEDLLQKFVEGHSVLDIGVVDHDISHIQSGGWKHRKLKKFAKKIVGVDILEEEVSMLNKMGFDVRLVDATSKADLGEKFERVVIGDVIEHVSNPVALLEFASRHLSDDGQIMVSTPNPFSIYYILRVIREGTFIANAEHISWITPTNALEIANRSGISLKNYYISQPKSLAKRLIKKILKIVLREDNEIYAATYIYIFSK
jgi:2-polyprenyl-3-methyl-5-hydroxy-6-metoxy-1,4-benzoquinol methylase